MPRKTKKVDFQSGFRKYTKGKEKPFVHDRTTTIGASELGTCERQLFYQKREPGVSDETIGAPTDPDVLEDYTDDWGHTTRGRVMEDHFVVPALKSMFTAKRLVFAGKKQQTFVHGLLSATPDALVVGVKDDALSLYDVPSLFGAECFIVEIKTFHKMTQPPKKKAKPRHELQVKLQAELIRRNTNYSPKVAVVLYVNAVDYEDVRPRIVDVSDTTDVYNWGKAKADRIFDKNLEAKDFLPEGRLSGTDCAYCNRRRSCAAIEAGKVPKGTDYTGLSEEEIAAVKALVIEINALNTQIKDQTLLAKQRSQELRDMLSVLDTRKVVGDDWGVTLYVSKGRASFDQKAAEEAGLDLAPYIKEGEPFTVLRTTVSKD